MKKLKKKLKAVRLPKVIKKVEVHPYPGYMLAAIDSACGKAYLQFNSRNKKWCVVAENIKTYFSSKSEDWEGDSPEDAINRVWCFLTCNPMRDDCFHPACHAEQNCLIVPDGNEEVWLRWDGFRWDEYVRQKSHGNFGTT